MISSFVFSTKIPKIYFGIGKFNELIHLIEKNGKNALIITGANSFKKTGKQDVLFNMLNERKINFFHVISENEPSSETIDNIVSKFRDKNIDIIIAIGGGSVIDTGKAISAMLPMNDSITNYIEGVGTKVHTGKKIFFIAVPTTAGTGTEVTKNAVICQIKKVGKEGYKKSLRHDNFIPDIAIIDPELTLNCPKNITAYSGMDAFTQLLEGFVSNKSMILTDTIALNGIKNLKNNLILAATQGDNLEARTAMSYAAFASGIVLANAGLGTVHGFASSIGGLFNIPHGVICGTLLSATTEITIKKIEKLKYIDKNNTSLKKYAKIGMILKGENCHSNINIEYGCKYLIETINDWQDKLNLPLLKNYGINANKIDYIASITDNKNNPAILNKNDLKTVLNRRL